MSNSAIFLSVQSEHSPSLGELINPVSKATIEFFDQSSPTQFGAGISLSSSDGLTAKDFASSQSLGFGELRCISQACVSDISVFESSASLVNVDPGLLANEHMAGIMDPMNESISFEALNSDLLCAVPHIQQALAGQLGHAELSQLISEIQAQVLELNTLSQDLFGDLSGDVQHAAVEAVNLDTDSLITSMQVDSGLFAQPEMASGDIHSQALAATLDGLFTSPESFPLTLDFSSASSVQEASELFAATGNASSISSSATGSDLDGGFVLPSSGVSDPS